MQQLVYDPVNLNLDPVTDNAKARSNLTIDYQFTAVTNSFIALTSDATTSMKVNLLCLDQYMYTISKEKGLSRSVV